ncbi:MAG TPA: hypothetical protein O0X99_00280, partial [Methanocorpusculum sp.]|nr:hypothetical protein [Methanocorpusculum sp.]
MHYALVSDLVSKDEFDELVNKKCAELGDAINDTCAAMLVVKDLGRGHVKIGDIKNISTPLFCFFGKILLINQPREFHRADNDADNNTDESVGYVSSIVLGDNTGTIKLTLWSDMAKGTEELELESVIEVIAKCNPNHYNDLVCIGLRPSHITIVDTKKPPKTEPIDTPIIAKIVYINRIQEITHQNGSISKLQKLLIGTQTGINTMITWNPDNFSDINEGDVIQFDGLTRKEYDGNITEYIVDDNVVITHKNTDINVLTSDVSEISEGQTSIVTGIVKTVSPIKSFITKQGRKSKVRNIVVGSTKNPSSNCNISVSCWNDAADVVVLPNDHIELINAIAKRNKYNNLELPISNNSAIRVVNTKGEYKVVEGYIVPRLRGMTIDTGTEVYLISTDCSQFTPAMRIRAEGLCNNFRISIDHFEELPSIPFQKL